MGSGTECVMSRRAVKSAEWSVLMKKVKEIPLIPKVAIGTSPRLAHARRDELLRTAKKDRFRRMNKVANNRAEGTCGG